MPRDLLYHRSFCLLLALVCAVCFDALPAHAGWREEVGYTEYSNAFGGNPPNGVGVTVGMVEAPVGGDGGPYLPDESFSQFLADTDPLGIALNVIDGSPGASNSNISDHATTTVGQNLFGNTVSLAGAVNTVTAYEANNFLNNFLKINGGTPLVPGYDIQNHSWVGELSSTNSARSAVRRLDSMIDTYEVITPVGLNNNGSVSQEILPTVGAMHPQLFSHSYNVIAVGRSNAYHTRGTTLSFYGPGRTKPDIVSPMFNVSAATASVSSAAASLYEIVDGTDAALSETMKAILLAGATKTEFLDFVDPATGLSNPWARTSSQPLDDLFGAGELNVFNSYLSVLGGQYAGNTMTATPVGSHGWDYQASITPGNDVLYEFEIPEGKTAKELSIILAWNVEITGNFNGQSLANLDLALRDSNGALVDSSTSTIDNVEHIYLTDLAAGTYTLEVSSDRTRDYGLAWRTSTLFDEPSADFDEDGDIDGSDFFAWQRGAGMLLNASHANGDADGDGDVDSDDLALFNAAFVGGVTPAVSALTMLVPEPSSGAIALVAFLSLWALRRGDGSTR